MNKIFFNLFIFFFFDNKPINVRGEYDDLKIKRWRSKN